jgi:hypothetical protein
MPPRKPQEATCGPIRAALNLALQAESQSPPDAATVALAVRYADDIDAGAVALDKAGPQLLAVLAALRLTPAARMAVTKGVSQTHASTALDELRARRRARADGA